MMKRFLALLTALMLLVPTALAEVSITITDSLGGGTIHSEYSDWGNAPFGVSYGSLRLIGITVDATQVSTAGADSLVRVYENGNSYQVFVLDPSSRDYKVIYKSEIYNL